MAYSQLYSVTTANQFLLDLSAFAATNGWTVDLDAVYATSYRRLHFHKGAAHFDLISAGATGLSMYHCTGYDSGALPSAQPGAGTNSGVGFALTALGSYWLVSTVGGLWMGLVDTGGNFQWGGFFIIQLKIGNYADGFGAHTPSPALLFSEGCGRNPYFNQIHVEGSWGAPGGAGELAGSGNSGDLPTKQPEKYNAGLIPFPILVCRFYPLDITKRQPLGFAPGVFRANGGDIYSVADELVIGSNTYLIMPRYTGGIGAASYGDYLFKLGA
jgi:hypothetical protein